MITREADYAIRAVLELASGMSGSSAAELARATQVPYPFLRRVLGRLTAARLVKSVRGRSGGMQLARPPGAISLRDVAQAIDPATITLNACLLDGGRCSLARRCPVHAPLARVQKELWRALDAVTFDTLVRHEQTTKPNKRRKP